MTKRATFFILIFIFLSISALFAQKGIRVVGKRPPELPAVVYRKGWALLIGINKYPNLPAKHQLDYAVADAEDFASLLQSKFGFTKSNITILKDKQATKQGILDAFSPLADPNKVKYNDCVLVYFSGHGQTVPLPKSKGEMGFLVPYDARIDLSARPNAAQYYRDCIGMDELKRVARLIPAKHIIFIVDACYSGLVLESARGLAPEVPGYLKKVATASTQQMITAGGKGEQSAERSDFGHGVFTHKLLEGLEKRIADWDNNGVITGCELGTYLRTFVPKIAQQTPEFRAEGEGEFLFLPQDVEEENQEILPPTIRDKDGAEMVLIPAGDFEMGTDTSEIPKLVQWAKQWYDVKADWFERETPRHTVYLDAFYMDKYEVTVGQYKKFISATGHKAPDWSRVSIYSPTDEHAMVFVSWEDAQAYSRWAGKRLPTEAEWEKAARGKLVGKKFPWGDKNPDGTQCNFADRNTDFPWSDKNVDDGYQYTAPVGSFPPNGYGLYDMAGNVWEWCADWYSEDYYKNSPTSNPQGPQNGDSSVCRGGSWDINPFNVRAAYRYWNSPTNFYNYLGFRCCVSSPGFLEQ